MLISRFTFLAINRLHTRLDHDHNKCEHHHINPMQICRVLSREY